MEPPPRPAATPAFGFRSNAGQLTLHLLLAVLIGVTLRLATFEEATSVAGRLGSDKYASRTSFLVCFGFTKALSNLAVGRASDVWGRKVPHAVGWGLGIVLGCLLLRLASLIEATDDDAPHRRQVWITYALANVCLGAQQGMTWTTNIFMFLDVAGPDHRAFASAASNSAGYLASACATYAAADLDAATAFRIVLACGAGGCLVATFLVRDTTDFVAREAADGRDGRRRRSAEGGGMLEMPRRPREAEGDEEEETADADATIRRRGDESPNNDGEGRALADRFDPDDVVDDDDRRSPPPVDDGASSFGSVLRETCWDNPSAAVLCWGGLTANLVTSLAWGLVLIWGSQQDLSALQLANVASGCLSDRIDGRRGVLAGGFLAAALGLLLTVRADDDDATTADDPSAVYLRLRLGGAVVGTGIGTVYPVLTAGMSDHAAPLDRASAVGVYKLWRDAGYAVGGLLTGTVADASGGSLGTTTTVVAVLAAVQAAAILGLYEEGGATTRAAEASFAPVELVEGDGKPREID